MSVFDERSQVILQDIVRLYIDSQEPVGSRTLSRQSSIRLSASSIRNVMSDLEYMGFITQPHTSAGRIPTDSGYRFYVDTLITQKREQRKQQDYSNVSDSLSRKADDKSQLLQETSRVLSAMTGCMALVSAPRLSQLPIRQVSFLGLGGKRLLVVLVTESGMVQNAVITTEAELRADDLEKINRFVNEHLVGISLQEAQRKLRVILEREMRQFRSLMEKLSVHTQSSDQQVYMEGLLRMLDGRRVEDIQKIQDLVKGFEEKKMIFDVIDHSLKAQGIKIFIGAENPVEDMSDYSVVVRNYGSDEQAPLGAIGVIGPKSMNYQHVIDIVDITASCLDDLMKS
ncbi:heat-inducible transcriptional repressor HrcA [Desulfurispirillum indicum]|uniref:Heat-inducible transcription repressor HrcA n=1 Tax=Desulfurispirillum indicum (strain ATCC BAA-1389 / DSM 22839 / S5) TaxID=653733 RepID=E6W4N5_DESIS|nr:heat-inducible transcriptional repressor HrcA [Desulfurispirillum indicum]ADU67108.1 heat-inducible transcription repressor HrcA [Desulfurispirillum indicum S5]UCZ56432.1 heat-inducible transcriptional repressor HrcA [Desulfurispirillum indicum]